MKKAFDFKFRKTRKRNKNNTTPFYTYDSEAYVGDTITYFTNRNNFSGKVVAVLAKFLIVKVGNQERYVEIR